jgi:acyl-coenzyme A thioesterase 13
MKITHHLCNRGGSLHGGAAATLFDNLTTMALMPIARKGFWAYAGVSRTLSCTYLRPVPLGEEVEIVCDVIHAGVRNAALRGEMRRVSDGAVMVVCEHGKASVDPEVTGRPRL